MRDCGYTLETPLRGVPTIYVLKQKYEKIVNPCTPQFHYIKVGCKGVFITRTCLHDVNTGFLMRLNKPLKRKESKPQNRAWAAPVAKWVRSLNFSALNHSIISPL